MTNPAASSAATDLQRQQRAAVLSLLSNLLLVTIKVAAGIASGAISVLAEGVQSMVDVLATVMILLSLRKAAEPPDARHPYGHEKVENLASLAQTVLILVSAGYLFWAAAQRWQHPLMPHVDWGVAALVTALVADAVVSTVLLRVSRDTNSNALHAEAIHLRSDMLSCSGVLIGLVAVRWFRQPLLDPAIAIVMTVVVVISAFKLMRDNLMPLLDERLPHADRQRILQVLDADPRVLGYHALRTRRAGATRFLDMHILLADDLSLKAAHAIGEEVEAAVRTQFPRTDVIVHVEPYEEEIAHQREAHRREVGERESERVRR